MAENGNRAETTAQGPQDTTPVGQQRGTEVTLENLKQVMRSVAKEVYEESRGARMQLEGTTIGGASGKRRHRAGVEKEFGLPRGWLEEKP